MAETILGRLAVEITAKATQFGKVLSEQEKALKGFQGTVSGVSNFLKGALATLGVAAIGKEIIDVTAEFQKFSAVLTNTLGSKSAAQIALRDIEDFAKRTPFAVDELTSSYVKLANQGFKPTTDELRKLGDLASSTGKGFDQLTEAIIDAQTGEFERLKEFGIRASKQGDQVKFTFKGVETQTKFTSQAIRDYILSLGDAEGVSGAMAAISETLGGQISNLGDSWTQFLKTIGDGNKGALAGAISGLTELVNQARELVKTNNQVKEDLQVEGQAAIIKDLEDLVSISGDVEAASATLIARLEEQKEAIVDQSKPLFANFEAHEDEIKILEQKASVIDAQIVAINDYTKAEEKRVVAAEEANKKEKASIGLIGAIEKQLKEFEAQKKTSFSTSEIASFNIKIDELKEKLEALNSIKPLSNFGQEQLKQASSGELDPFGGVKKISLPSEQDRVTGDAFKGPEITDDQVDTYIAQLKKMTDAQVAAGVLGTRNTEQSIAEYDALIKKQDEQKQAASEFGNIFGSVIGAALNDQQSFSKSMQKVTKDLIATFLARALAAAISTSFSSSGNPVIGAALAAASSAVVVGLFSGIGGGSSGKGVSSSVPRAPTQTRSGAVDRQITGDQIILVGGELRAKGTDMVLVFDRVKKQQQRSG